MKDGLYLFLFLLIFPLNLSAQRIGIFYPLDERKIEGNYKKDPGSVQYKLDYVDLLLSHENYGDAFLILSKLHGIEDQEQTARAHLQSVRIYLKRNDLDNAKKGIEDFYTHFGKSAFKDAYGTPLLTLAEILKGIYYANQNNAPEAARTFYALLKKYPASDREQNNILIRISVLTEMLRYFAYIDDAPMMQSTLAEIEDILPVTDDKNLVMKIKVVIYHLRAFNATITGEKERMKEYTLQAEKILQEVSPVSPAAWKTQLIRQKLCNAYRLYLSEQYNEARDIVVPLLFEFDRIAGSDVFMYEERCLARLLASSVFLAKGQYSVSDLYLGNFLADHSPVKQDRNIYNNQSVFMYQAITSIREQFNDLSDFNLWYEFQQNYYQYAGRNRTNYAQKKRKELSSVAHKLKREGPQYSRFNKDLDTIVARYDRIKKKRSEIKSLVENKRDNEAVPLISQTLDLYKDFLYHNYTAAEYFPHFFNFCYVSINIAKDADNDKGQLLERVTEEVFLVYTFHMIQMAMEFGDKPKWKEYHNSSLPFALFSKELDDDNLTEATRHYLKLCTTIADNLKGRDKDLTVDILDIGLTVCKQVCSYRDNTENKMIMIEFVAHGMKTFIDMGITGSDKYKQWEEELKNI